MEKLTCDGCGAEYTDAESIATAKGMMEVWARMCREDGVEPRGISPCPNIQCKGELVLTS